MNFPFYIAKRYLFAKNSNNAINIITLIAMFGVIVGSLALFIILSGFSGLKTFSDSLLEMSDPDIKITATKGKSFLFNDSIYNVLHKNNNVKAYAKVIEERVFLRYKNKENIAFIKGVDDSYNKIIKIDSSLVMGTWLDNEYENTAVIGNGISYKLSLGILNFDEALSIYVPKSGKGFINPNNAFKRTTAQIVGVYGGTEEFQNKYVFVDINQARSLLQYDNNQITAIELALNDITKSNDIKKQLQKQLGNQYNVSTKAELNKLFYRVINTEKIISYLIFTLIVIIALFNVIGAIIMMIIDKRYNLKTLFNLGTTLKEIKRVFVLQGFLLTLFGMIIGLLLGVILVFLQQKYGWFLITQEIPYPVELKLSNILLVMLTIAILGYLASKIASSRISERFIEE